MGKYNKIFCFFFFVFILESNVFAYRIPEDEVRKLETLDNEICLSRGHSLDSEYTIELYWKCRLFLIDERIDDQSNLKGKNKFYVTELKRIKKVIENVLERIRSDLKTQQENLDSVQKRRKPILKNIDQYYYNLLSFLSYDYSTDAVNTKREIKKIIEYREKQEKERKKTSFEELLREYPVCIRYDKDSKEFNGCVEHYQRVRECKVAIIKKMKDNENQVKFNCKKQAIAEYPDYMALYNSEFEELKSIRQDTYSYDKQEKKRIENRITELNKLMSGPRLTKNQLINLRKYAEEKCLVDSELERNLFRTTISDECEKLLGEM
ncbi:MAG: hypothetical protein LBG48_01385 [Rickettsiales bacterium]|jgi:hypothetical protein|nr:hypothetical protein [Rickettsiales bacterium]